MDAYKTQTTGWVALVPFRNEGDIAFAKHLVCSGDDEGLNRKGLNPKGSFQKRPTPDVEEIERDLSQIYLPLLMLL